MRVSGWQESRPVRHAMENFLSQIGSKELSEWEELHTATVDLSPKFVPYVGHAVWGENYRRGSFMADLSRAMRDDGVFMQCFPLYQLTPELFHTVLANLVEAFPQWKVTALLNNESARITIASACIPGIIAFAQARQESFIYFQF